MARVADIEAEALDMLRLRVLALLDGATPRNAVARIDAVEDALLRGYDVLLEAVIAEVARELVVGPADGGCGRDERSAEAGAIAR